MPKIVHLNNIENVKNKTNIIDKDSTSEQYPSAKAVYEMLSSIEPGGGTSEGSCSNTFIEEGVNTWAELNDTLVAYDKNFTNGGSVTVYLTDSFFGVAGYYNIKQMLDTVCDYVAVDISNPAKSVYKFNRKNYTYEFIGNESFELTDGSIELNHLSAEVKDQLKTVEVIFNLGEVDTMRELKDIECVYKSPYIFKFTNNFPSDRPLYDSQYESLRNELMIGFFDEVGPTSNPIKTFVFRPMVKADTTQYQIHFNADNEILSYYYPKLIMTDTDGTLKQLVLENGQIKAIEYYHF